jgi:hypothetical protein
MSNQEVSPGIFLKEINGRHTLWIEDQDEELFGWDYEEIRTNPDAWFSSLKAVSLATQYGPSVAKKWVKDRQAELDSPYNSIVCNVCEQKFIAAPDHPFVFAASLNGKKFLEFQCSDVCCKKRQQSVYKEEIGEDFMELWSSKVFKS